MAKYVRQSKEQIRRKRVRTVITSILIFAAVVTAAVIFFRRRVQEEFGSTGNDDILTAQVSVGSIKTTVSGSGTLTSEGVMDVEYPASVTVDDLLVEAGDPVEAGDILATVNVSSALSALKELQEELEELDKTLAEASNDTASSYIRSSIAGRVKAIFVETDSVVSSIMAEHGALLILSLDGCMAVDIPAGTLAEGDSIDVTDSSGKIYAGSVSKIVGETATVLVTDNGPLYGDTVTVGDQSGVLYIHSPLKITGYAGTVRYVNVKENAQVWKNSNLLTLKDTEYSANYDQLLADREELEQTYQQLIRIYRDGGIRAETSGTVQSLQDETGTLTADASLTTETDLNAKTVLLSIDPDEEVSITINVDETDIQSLELGQEAIVTISSIGEDTFVAQVTEINKFATSSSGVTMYTATVTLEKTPQMLSGMSASVDITIEGVEGALIVPEDAVRRTSATSYVYTTYDEETGEMGGMVEVTTGLSNGSYIEITSGLREGDTVYYTEKETGFNFFGFSGMGSGGRGTNSGMGSGSGMPGGMGSGSGMPGGMGSGSGMPGGSPRG